MWQGQRLFLLLVCIISPWCYPVAMASTPRACSDDLESTIGQMLPQLSAYANRAFHRRRPPQEPYTPTYVILAGKPEFEPLPIGAWGTSGPGDQGTGGPGNQGNTPRLPVSPSPPLPPTLPVLPPYPVDMRVPQWSGGLPVPRSVSEAEPPSPSPPRVPTGETGEPQQAFITTLERQYTPNGVVFLQRFHWLFLTKVADGWELVQMFSIQGPTQAGQPPTPPEESRDSFIGEAIRSWLQDCRSQSQ